jgi:hypothetical protein
MLLSTSRQRLRGVCQITRPHGQAHSAVAALRQFVQGRHIEELT